MKNFNYLIIGGGIAGTTGAETIRQNDPDGSIAIVSEEPHRLYSRIMLSKPNFFLEKIPFGRVWLKEENWYAENRIEFFGGKKAVMLDSAKKTVTLDDGAEIGYEKLLLSVGGEARRWDAPGARKQGVFYLRTLEDAKKIISGVKTAKQAIAIGGGFVSFEMCDMLKMAGLEVTLILREAYYWEPVLDETSGRMIEAALEKGGVKIIKETEAKNIPGESIVEKIILNDGIALPCQMIIAGIGVFCPLDWLEGAGLKINRGILADEYLRTNILGVWTAGDAAEFNDLILGERVQLGNWVNAQMQGKIAGLNMSRAEQEPFKMVSSYTTNGFGITVAFVGDARPGNGRTIIPRGSFESGSYGRIIVKNGEIVGATLINRTQELAPLSRLIARDFKISGFENNISDYNFDLRSLAR